ncbi:MAG: HAMP domain-containing histidine kinase [Actinomycetota bacterium]|nr:HAMP domain-containing histidine kinase [Actinomycetota bacterium]
MRFSPTALAPPSWLRLSHRTARMRLSLLYAGMFLVTGTLVLALVYLFTGSSSAIAVVPVHARSGILISPGAGGTVAPVPPVPSVPIPGFRTIVSQQHSADQSRLLAASWLALALATAASALFGWIAAGRVLRPLRTITKTARNISAGSLHQRLALAGPNDEFKQLGDTLDDLLGRLEASFEAQRRFVANASHELRTPLTLERTLIQVALADPGASAETLRSTCEELLTSGRDHERLLEGLLTLASSERGLERREQLDLARVADQVLLASRPEAEELRLLLEPALAPAPISGDRALIERLIANLTDNALHYNQPGGRVEVRTATEDGHAVLTISNSGPVIPAEEIDRLFEPFQRLGADRTALGAGSGGHGLGLSIARAIATAHDAVIAAEPEPEGGLVVTVRFRGIDEPPGTQPRANR